MFYTYHTYQRIFLLVQDVCEACSVLHITGKIGEKLSYPGM